MERIFVVGVNHKTAGLEVRERLALTGERLLSALQALHAELSEVVILSTCNRTEVYGVCDDARRGEERVMGTLLQARQPAPSPLRESLTSCHGLAAVRHLLQVAAGLDSMVVGECEIQGQVQEAYRVAKQAGATGPILNALFQRAARVGKRARNETEIGRTAHSIAEVVVDLARRVLGDLEQRTALLVGAGKMGSLTGQRLVSAGLRCILVANRTYDRAQKLAEELEGRAVHFDALPGGLAEADVVICSTGAPHVVLHRRAVEAAQALRAGRPLLIVDLAVPRDVEPAAALVPSVTLADMDSLEQFLVGRRAVGASAREEAEAIIEQELASFEEWLGSRATVPIISALWRKAEAIQAKELAAALNKLGDLTPHQRQIVGGLASSITGKLLHDPVTRLRSSANGQQQREYLDVARRLFDLPKDGPEQESTISPGNRQIRSHPQ